MTTSRVQYSYALKHENSQLSLVTRLGLIKKVSLNDTDLVTYSYLADGTKVSALDGDEDGILYLGSLIYKRQGESISLESAGFAGGRFVARTSAPGVSAMVPMIHVTDHLGSVRAVVDGVSGEEVETNDYYPFGSRWDVAAGLKDETNRFRYNGKEEQSSLYPASFRNAAGYIDYGARQYDPVLGRWFAQDPLLEKYYGISPYAFCNNNPVNYVDPDVRKLRVASEYQNQFKEETIYKFTPNRQLIPTPRALFSVVIIGKLANLNVSAESQLSCRQRKGLFVGDDG